MPETSNPDLSAMGEIYFSLCKSVDSSVSLACWLLYKYGEFEQLAGKKVQPQHYHNMTRFRDDYLVCSYLSKWKGLPTGVDLEAVALTGFAACELKCKETNRRLRATALGDFNPNVEPILLLAQRKIAEVLEGARWFDALENCGWGKGATSTLKGDDANLVRKIDPARGRISVTRHARQLATTVVESDPAWMAALARAEVVGPYSVVPDFVFEIVEGNRIVTVPKDATKDRTIAAEPTANIFMQLGVGRLFRKLLRKRCGIDLDDQGHNQRYALLGSKTGEFATLDLKSASDTVSKELVYQLFPQGWSVLLDRLRSPKGTIEKGVWFEYEKFSSMGNGFTFELETLIFYALAVACAQHHGMSGRVLVYGDDVIIPSKMDAAYREILEYCGFEVNTKKSFASGPFRESCGRHYWLGIDVTPVYQKECFFQKGVKSLPEAYRCANRVFRLAARRGHGRWFDVLLRPMWMACLRVFGFSELNRVRHVIPWESEGDDGLALPWEDLHHHISGAGHGMVKLPVLSFRPKRLRVKSEEQGALLAYWLRQSLGKDVDVPDVPKSGRCSVVNSITLMLRAHNEPFAGRIVVRRRGTYVSRRRLYPIGTRNVAWM